MSRSRVGVIYFQNKIKNTLFSRNTTKMFIYIILSLNLPSNRFLRRHAPQASGNWLFDNFCRFFCFCILLVPKATFTSGQTLVDNVQKVTLNMFELSMTYIRAERRQLASLWFTYS